MRLRFVHQLLTFSEIVRRFVGATAEELHTYFTSMLQLLVRHASDYLTREECETCLARHLSEYYRFLGKSLMLVLLRSSSGSI